MGPSGKQQKRLRAAGGGRNPIPSRALTFSHQPSLCLQPPKTTWPPCPPCSHGSLRPPHTEWLAKASGWRCHLPSKGPVAAAKWHNDLFKPKVQHHPHLPGQEDTEPHVRSSLTSDCEARCPGHQDHKLRVIKCVRWLHIKYNAIGAKVLAPALPQALSKIAQKLQEMMFSFLPFRQGS